MDPVMQDLDKYLEGLDNDGDREEAINTLGEQLELACTKAIRLTLMATVYDTTAMDLSTIINGNNYFYYVAERLIKAHEKGQK